MTLAKTNEERFIGACEKVGEVEVRQRLNAGRYDGRKVAWASNWLELIQDDKSDATKAAEVSRLIPPPHAGRLVWFGVAAVLAGIVIAGGIAVFGF